MSTEKETSAPDYVSSGSDHAHDTKHHHATATHDAHGQRILDSAYGEEFGVKREMNFYTRNGLNFESFKKRSSGDGIVELDRSMKKRHLHMIAIGELECCSLGIKYADNIPKVVPLELVSSSDLVVPSSRVVPPLFLSTS